MYYNYIGVFVLSKFCTEGCWDLYSSKDDQSSKSCAIAARYSGNMFEHAPVFFPALWMYTLLVDASSGAYFGSLYLVARLTYPFFYMIHRQFNFWFECNTQVGYGATGTLLLGVVFVALGWDWVAFVEANKMWAGLCGYMFGSVILLPGLPLTPLYTFIHYKFDKASLQKKAN